MKRGSIRRRGGETFAVAAFLLATLGPAHGQSPPPPAPPPAATAPPAPSPPPGPSPGKPAKAARFDAAAVASDLASPSTIAAALAAVQSAGPAAKKLAPQIEELLRRGLPPDLAVQAITALGAIGATSSSPVIASHMQHRDAAVRKAAALALARTRGADATAALLAGLRSHDAVLRDLSAAGLAAAGNSDSLPDLLRALDRGVTPAAAAIAALCPPEQCKDLLARWESIVRWDRIVPGTQAHVLDAMLQRKPPLPDDVLLYAVAKAKASDGETTRAYFASMKRDPKLSPRVRKAIEAAARAPDENPSPQRKELRQ